MRLVDLTSKIGSGATPKGGKYAYVQQGVAFIRSQNVHDHRMSNDGLARITGKAAQALSNVEVLSGDVLLNITGDSVARCSVVDSSWLPARVSQHVAIIRANEQLNPIYLQKYLTHPIVKSFMLSLSTGGTRPALTKAQIMDFPILCPPRHTQDAMATFARVLDCKMATNERIVATALQLASVYYSLACSDSSKTQEFLIGDLAQIFDGPHATPSKTTEGPWFLSISSLNQGRLNLGESAHLSEVDFAKWTRRVSPRPGDVLFSYETRLGEAALMPEGVQGCLGRRMAIMRPRDERITSHVLLFAFLGDDFQEMIRQRTVRGATVDRIPLVDLPSWPIRIPRPNEQQWLADLLSALYSKVTSVERESRTLADLRDTLLPKLISGELRVEDAKESVAAVV